MLREKHKNERKQQILEAARRLIQKDGLPHMSMRELAIEAQVSLKTPYNLFGSKAQVLGALLESFSVRVETALNELDLRDPIDALYALGRLSVQEFARDPNFYRSLFMALMTTGELLPSLRNVQHYTTFWQRGIDAGIAQGFFESRRHPDLVARHIQVMHRGLTELWIEGGIDLEGFETELLYGMTLSLLAVATQKGRPQLLRRLRDLEQQLDRQIHE